MVGEPHARERIHGFFHRAELIRHRSHARANLIGLACGRSCARRAQQAQQRLHRVLVARAMRIPALQLHEARKHAARTPSDDVVATSHQRAQSVAQTANLRRAQLGPRRGRRLRNVPNRVERLVEGLAVVRIVGEQRHQIGDGQHRSFSSRLASSRQKKNHGQETVGAA